MAKEQQEPMLSCSAVLALSPVLVEEAAISTVGSEDWADLVAQEEAQAVMAT